MSVRKLSSELQKKSETELNEIPERLANDLNCIRQWISKQPHLNIRQDDQWLLNFLRGCKFSLEKTKQKLDMFYTARTMLPEFFSNRDPFLPEIQEVLELGVLLPLPKTKEPDSPRIILARCADVDPLKVSFITIIKTCTMIVDILLNEDDNFVIAGQIGIIDSKGATLGHTSQLTASLCKKIVTCVLDSYPSRLKEISVINSPAFFENIYNLVFKPFIKLKILNRIYIYSNKNSDEVYRTIPPSLLPIEYGGQDMSLNELTATWKQKVESYRNWFIEDAKYCSDETQRIGEPLTPECMFGIAGSFRQADFD